MKLRRLSAFCLLCGFLSFTLEMEIREAVMFGSMIQNDASSLGWFGAADQALSGEKPCPGCISLSRERVAEEEEAGMAPASAPDTEILFASTPDPFSGPGFRRSGLRSDPLLPTTRQLDPPEPPPVQG